jgi:hypothetical protein
MACALGHKACRDNFDPYAPETKEVFTEIACFFDKHLGK